MAMLNARLDREEAPEYRPGPPPYRMMSQEQGILWIMCGSFIVAYCQTSFSARNPKYLRPTQHTQHTTVEWQ